MDKKISEGQPRSATRTFLPNIFIVFALLLIIFPFVTTFNSFLTNLLLKWQWYRILQDFVVPYESKVLAGALSLFAQSARPTTEGVWLNGGFLQIEWNCLGWQSGILLLASFLTGFQGKFSWISKAEVIVIGVLGTYLVNFTRLVSVAFISQIWGSRLAILFHDYLALLLVIAWFFVFWWFSYSFVLEERGLKIPKQD
jgi:exosortase/archaeosortase family protein